MRPSHVLHTFLGEQPAPGAGRAGELGQAAHQRARQGGAGPAAGRTGRQTPGAGARRLGLRQRGHPAGAGAAASSPTCCGCGRPRTCSAWWRSSSPARTGAGPTTRAARWSRPNCSCTAGAPSAGWSSCASASAVASHASGAWTASNCGWTWRARACTRATGCGSTRCWSRTWPTQLESIGQLYRDRADAENAFDELKNQWGLGGFTTQDINRCQTVARACALVVSVPRTHPWR